MIMLYPNLCYDKEYYCIVCMSYCRQDQTIRDLIYSYDVYEDLMAKSQKGLEFYRKLEVDVGRLLVRCRGVCKEQEGKMFIFFKNIYIIYFRRDQTIRDLINSYDVYEDLMAKYQKGLEFYKKLEVNVG